MHDSIQFNPPRMSIKECTSCGRIYETTELPPDAPCPSDDCPSHFRKNAIELITEFLCDQETLAPGIRNEALCEKSRKLLKIEDV